MHHEFIDVYENDPNFAWLKENEYLADFDLDGEYAMEQEPSSNRCIALKGEVGVNVQCSIYDHRPEGCRIYERAEERCRTAVFIQITRKGKSLFTDDPDSWPSR